MNTRLLSCNRQVLARAAEGNYVHGFDLASVNFADVAKMFHVREAVRRHPNGEVLNLGCPHRLNPEQRTGKWETAGAVEKTA